MRDTLPISFSFLAIQGIDSEKYIDSIVNVSGTGKNSVQLPLKKFSESSKFLFLSAQNQPIEEYIFKEKRSNTGSLCPQNSDSISVYSNGENEFLLCNEIDRINEANNVIIVVNNDQLEEFFFRYKNQDTLRISRPTKDTLNINYTYTQEFVSAECGCLTTFELDEVQYTNHYINEAIISNKSVKSSIVNNPDDKHIKIYFKNY